MSALMAMKAPKILVPMEYFASDIPGSGRDCARLFEPIWITGGLWPLKDTPHGQRESSRNSCVFRYLTCTTSFILGWIWQRTSKVPDCGKLSVRFSPGAFSSESNSPDHIDLMDEFVMVGEGQRFAAVDGDFAGMKGASLLHDDMGVFAEGGAGHEQCRRGRQERSLHRVTTRC